MPPLTAYRLPPTYLPDRVRCFSCEQTIPVIFNRQLCEIYRYKSLPKPRATQTLAVIVVGIRGEEGSQTLTISASLVYSLIPCERK
jgi:hypothetical protein